MKRFSKFCFLVIGSMSAIALSGQSAYAFDLGGFLKGFSGQAGNRYHRQPVHIDRSSGDGNQTRIFHSIQDGSTSSSCRANYQRNMSNYGWQNQPQYSEGPCPQWAIQKLEEKEKSAYAERVRFCYADLKSRYGYKVDDYIGKVSSSLCGDYAAGRDISRALQEQLAYYSKLASEDRKRIADEEKASRDSAYASASTWADNAQNRINRTNSEKSFIYKGSNAGTVFVNSIVIRSMRPGTTYGGSRVVDVNIITQGYESQATETRYRIFCNEGKNSRLEAGVIAGGSTFVTGEMGRWICGRYGIYHPG